MLLSSCCSGKFDYSSNDIIVSLKRYDEKDNNQTFETDCLLEISDPLNKTMLYMEICSDQKVDENLKKEGAICLKSEGKGLRVIKSSYNTYIPTVVSQKIDCNSRVSKHTPGHLHIVTLIEHVMDSADVLIFCKRMNELKDTCALSEKNGDKNTSYPHKPPVCIPQWIREKYKGCFIMKTLLWALQYSLSCMYQSNKMHSIEFSNPLELTTAHDGAYIICGYINPDCLLNATPNQRTEYPHDPSYDIVSRNEQCSEIRTVMLYFPSTGTYYSP